MIHSSISLSLEVQPSIKNELTFRNRRHHRLVRKRGSKLTVKPGTKRQIPLHRGTTRVTSVSPNAKLTLFPVNQVLYRSNFGGKSRAGRICIILMNFQHGGICCDASGFSGEFDHRLHNFRWPFFCYNIRFGKFGNSKVRFWRRSSYI